MKCIRCGNDIGEDAPEGVNVCGGCADDLRQEEEYERMCEAELNRMGAEYDAYLDSLWEEQFDGGLDRYR